MLHKRNVPHATRIPFRVAMEKMMKNDITICDIGNVIIKLDLPLLFDSKKITQEVISRKAYMELILYEYNKSILSLRYGYDHNEVTVDNCFDFVNSDSLILTRLCNYMDKTSALYMLAYDLSNIFKKVTISFNYVDEKIVPTRLIAGGFFYDWCNEDKEDFMAIFKCPIIV